MRNVIVWGGTGNFKVVREIIESQGDQVVALFDNNRQIVPPGPGIEFPGGRDSFPDWIKASVFSDLYGVVCIGGKYGKDRLELQELMVAHGVKPLKLLNKSAHISPTATIGDGSQVYAMAAVCTDAVIGKACIINTSASVDHDCRIGDGVFIGPGARLAGEITVGNFADIYTGAVILPRLRIGEGAVVGAGAVVLQDIQPYAVVAGNPARIIKMRVV